MNKYYTHFYNYVAQEEQTIFIEANNEEEAEYIAYLYVVSRIGKDMADHIRKIDGLDVCELDESFFKTYKDVEKYEELVRGKADEQY